MRRDGHRPRRGHRRLRGGLRARGARGPAAQLPTLERLCSALADRLLDDFDAEEVWVKATKPEPPIPLPVEEVSVEVWRQSPGPVTARASRPPPRSSRSAAGALAPTVDRHVVVRAQRPQRRLPGRDRPARAHGRADDAGAPPRSLTCHYLRPPAGGRGADRGRRGARRARSVTRSRARLLAGRPPVRRSRWRRFARDSRARRRLRRATARRAAARRGRRRPPTRRRRRSPTASRSARRSAPRPFAGADEALTGGWMRLARARRRSTRPRWRCYADAWLPSPFMRLTRPSPAPTIDLTMHFRAPAPPRRSPGAPVLALFRSRPRPDGFFEEDGEMWTPRRDAARPAPPARAARRARDGDRLPRPRLERRRPARAPPGRRRRARRPRRRACGLVVDLRHRPGGRDPRPARVPQRLRADRDRPRPRGAARRLQGRRARARAATSRAASRHGPRPIDVDVLLLGDREHRSERLTLPHAQARRGGSCSIPLLELDFELRTPDGTGCATRSPAAARRGRAPGRGAAARPG